MDNVFKDNSFSSNATRGLLAGFLGGLAGSAVKSAVEQFLDVRKIDEKSAQLKVVDELSEKITGSPIEVQNEGIVEQLVNIPLGASVGAAYGYSRRDKDDVNIVDGMILGASTWASTHETTFPLIGLEKSPKEIPVKIQLNELFAHVVFGVTTEIMRGFVSDRLKKNE